MTQRYCCIMIPALVSVPGSPWKLLPPGLHAATLAEVRKAFATNPHRKRLYTGLKNALQALADAGCEVVYIDGSYVSAKPRPSDYDLCWDHKGVDGKKLDPVIIDFKAGRAKQNEKYKGDILPAAIPSIAGSTILDFFQKDKFSGKKKGVVVIFLKSESLLKPEE